MEHAISAECIYITNSPKFNGSCFMRCSYASTCYLLTCAEAEVAARDSATVTSMTFRYDHY
ncbi:hypothetical protein FA95DRAFT_1552658 [Auriscalpium vulgare]|uniref:Uncharacterized protein n=1 Tax=Auriscalpium vulgare TaxID=40419 RepID=A0ACB8SA38_9AGAM|nr:hypothetical protein FA95DRAFT_1552658 [Auriscalpium vulgare]